MRKVMTRVFPEPGAGEDQYRAFAVEHGFALLRIQLVEEIHGGSSLYDAYVAALARSQN